MSHHYQNLIDSLEKEGYLKTPEIIAAFRHIKRHDFVLSGLEHESHYNYPLLIGYGQTISQPATVAFMLELLQPTGRRKNSGYRCRFRLANNFTSSISWSPRADYCSRKNSRVS